MFLWRQKRNPSSVLRKEACFISGSTFSTWFFTHFVVQCSNSKHSLQFPIFTPWALISILVLFFAVSRARILGDRDVLVQVGSDINLTCRAEESPDAPETVVWYKNEVRVDNLLARGGISVVTESRRRTSTLLVSKVNKMDAGNYTCVPSNARADSVMVHVIDGR